MNEKNWHSLPLNDRMELLRMYKGQGFSYNEAIEDFNNFMQEQQMYPEEAVMQESMDYQGQDEMQGIYNDELSNTEESLEEQYDPVMEAFNEIEFPNSIETLKSIYNRILDTNSSNLQ